MNSPEQSFTDWCGLRPKGDAASRAELLREFYRKQSAVMHRYNQQAAIHGRRASWAFRQMRAEEEAAKRKAKDVGDAAG